MKPWLTLLLTFCLSSCVSLPESEEQLSESRIKLEAWEEVAMEGLKETDTPQGLELAVIDWGEDPAWGKASWRQGPKGNYQLSYATSGQEGIRVGEALVKNVFLHATPQALETAADDLTSEWKSLSVVGLKREIRFYVAQTGAEGEPSRWETEVFSYQDSRGRLGWYMVSMESTSEEAVRMILGKLRAR